MVTPEDIEQTCSVQAWQSLRETDTSRFSDLDLEFHRIIIEARIQAQPYTLVIPQDPCQSKNGTMRLYLNTSSAGTRGPLLRHGAPRGGDLHRNRA